MIHELKTHPIPFKQVKSGQKTFEIRFNDRGFQVGDELLLKEFTPKDYWEDGEQEIGYSGEICHRQVIHILKGSYGVEKGYVIMSLSKI
jgi:hypothetical protein